MDDVQTELPVDPRNPDVGKPIRRRGRKAAAPTGRIEGADLVPDLVAHGKVAVSRTYRYWVGVTPSCPVESVTLGGISFPKLNEDIVPDPMRTGQKRRVPVIGAITLMDARQIERVRDSLRRTVIRFYDDAGEVVEANTGQNVGDAHRRPRRGQLISIPSPELVEARRKQGRPIRPYVPHANDVPAARYLFAVLCDDQERGSRGDYYPETLETTGLEYPQE